MHGVSPVYNGRGGACAPHPGKVEVVPPVTENSAEMFLLTEAFFAPQRLPGL